MKEQNRFKLPNPFNGEYPYPTEAELRRREENRERVERERNQSIPSFSPRINRKDPLWGVTDLADRTKERKWR